MVSDRMIKWNGVVTTIITIMLITIYSLDLDNSFNPRNTRRADYIEPFLLFEAVLGVVKLGDMVYTKGQWPFRRVNYSKEHSKRSMLFKVKYALREEVKRMQARIEEGTRDK